MRGGQVISLFFITLRVANRTALTSDAVASGSVGSIHFRSAGGSARGPIDSNGVSQTPSQLGVGFETGSQET